MVKLHGFSLSRVAVLRDRLNCAVGLGWFGWVLTMIVVVCVNLSCVVDVTQTLKKVMHSVGLGKAQEEQKERA
jgi:hypothetical protein